MEMRKFIVEIHPDGSLTCCEYEDSENAIRAANDRSWLSGYRQALIHCGDQVELLKGDSVEARLMRQGATLVRDGAEKMYRKYAQIFQH